MSSSNKATTGRGLRLGLLFVVGTACGDTEPAGLSASCPAGWRVDVELLAPPQIGLDRATPALRQPLMYVDGDYFYFDGHDVPVARVSVNGGPEESLESAPVGRLQGVRYGTVVTATGPATISSVTVWRAGRSRVFSSAGSSSVQIEADRLSWSELGGYVDVDLDAMLATRVSGRCNSRQLDSKGTICWRGGEITFEREDTALQYSLPEGLNVQGFASGPAGFFVQGFQDQTERSFTVDYEGRRRDVLGLPRVNCFGSIGQDDGFVVPCTVGALNQQESGIHLVRDGRVSVLETFANVGQPAVDGEWLVLPIRRASEADLELVAYDTKTLASAAIPLEPSGRILMLRDSVVLWTYPMGPERLFAAARLTRICPTP